MHPFSLTLPLALSTLGIKFSRRYFEICVSYLFLENRICHFMQLSSKEWNVKFYFLIKKQRKISLICRCWIHFPILIWFTSKFWFKSSNQKYFLHWEHPLPECKFTCGRSETEEMNDVIAENVSIIYISKQFRGFCVSHRKTRVSREQTGISVLEWYAWSC